MSKEDEDANEFTRVLQLNSGNILGMVMKAAIEVDLFEVMAKAAAVNGTSPFGDDAKKLSSDDIVARLPTQNPAATSMLERILRFLAANSILIRTQVAGEDGQEKSLYSLASICKHYIADEDGVSLAPLLVMLHDKVIIDSWRIETEVEFAGLEISGFDFDRMDIDVHFKPSEAHNQLAALQWQCSCKRAALEASLDDWITHLMHMIRCFLC
ncbi:dimerization domain-containing protein [Heracleum sosnowskyi]|uniref:Dimerization domain-containing protein n=1 Tax=Heracleum sosnowskyi TaxID=360622 RepID=A0AAD8J170_9APIA|nr:dimerization domain-containing protein [Heracleum sosnowskyi]